jgi:hypothetical protein
MRAIPSFKRDKTKNKTFYCFDINDSDYESPMSQYLAEVGMSSLPIIAPNFFMDNKVLSDNLLHEMSCYIAEKPSKTSAPTGKPNQGCHINVATASDWGTQRERAQSLTIPKARKNKNENI